MLRRMARPRSPPTARAHHRRQTPATTNAAGLRRPREPSPAANGIQVIVQPTVGLPRKREREFHHAIRNPPRGRVFARRRRRPQAWRCCRSVPWPETCAAPARSRPTPGARAGAWKASLPRIPRARRTRPRRHPPSPQAHSWPPRPAGGEARRAAPHDRPLERGRHVLPRYRQLPLGEAEETQVNVHHGHLCVHRTHCLGVGWPRGRISTVSPSANSA